MPPENPQIFLRLVNTLVAHNQPMVRPRISGDFDYEGELAVIIGKQRVSGLEPETGCAPMSDWNPCSFA